jgi:hypothetical protein
MEKNLLCYGDNLDILRRYVWDETVDLVCADPPFNSNATSLLLGLPVHPSSIHMRRLDRTGLGRYKSYWGS